MPDWLPFGWGGTQPDQPSGDQAMAPDLARLLAAIQANPIGSNCSILFIRT